jgi:hypothetical protein
MRVNRVDLRYVAPGHEFLTELRMNVSPYHDNRQKVRLQTVSFDVDMSGRVIKCARRCLECVLDPERSWNNIFSGM